MTSKSEKERIASIHVREILNNSVARVVTFLASGKTFSIDELEYRKSMLLDYNKEFLEVQMKLELLDLDDPERAAEHASEREKFESAYDDCIVDVNRNLRILQDNQQNNSRKSAETSVSNVTIRQSHNLLPKIEIPTFNGNLLEWYSFHDTFKSVIHDNEELPGVQKFHYLKNVLRGDMVSLISSLNASEENYEIAWKLLKDRCNKPRQIMFSHLKSFLDLPEITRDTPTNLRSLSEKAQMHVNALKALKVPMEN